MKTIGVLGCGLMGAGIAQVSAAAGFRTIVLEVTGGSEKLDAMVELLRKFKIVELVRTGKVIMARGEDET